MFGASTTPDTRAIRMTGIMSVVERWLDAWLAMTPKGNQPAQLPPGWYASAHKLLTEAYEAAALGDKRDGGMPQRSYGESTTYEFVCRGLPRVLQNDQERTAFIGAVLDLLEDLQHGRGTAALNKERLLIEIAREMFETLRNLGSAASYTMHMDGSRSVPHGQPS